MVRRVADIIDENPNLLYCLDPGIVVIINNEIFDGNTKLKNRRASSKDVEALVHLFENVLLWEKPYIYEDQSVNDMKNMLAYYSEKISYKGFNSFFCIILSHGNQRGIYGTDGRIITTETILDYFSAEKCPDLAFKPKVFIFQACRGDADDRGFSITTDAEGENMPSLIRIPNMSDFLVTYPCVPGYTSLRHEEKGSIYIQNLVKIFQNYRYKDSLAELLLRLNHVITRTESSSKMMPCQDIRMTKICCFEKWFKHVLGCSVSSAATSSDQYSI